MPTLTTNFGLLQPLVDSSTDSDLWGGYLNTDIADIDSLVLTSLNFVTSVQTSATLSVVAPTSGSSTTGSAKALFLCNATSNTITADLPTASNSGNGFTVCFKKTDSSTNAVTVTPNNTDTIEGSATFVLSASKSWVILVSDGISNWNVISEQFVAPTPKAPPQLNQAFLTSGTSWESSSTITSSTVFKITLVGGGGGTNGGGGSGAGATGVVWVTGLQASTAYTYAIGAGGSGSGQNAGGNTTFTDATPTTYTAGGGSPGGSQVGGAGGTCTNCEIEVAGQHGGYDNASSGGYGFPSAGSSLWGGGGSGAGSIVYAASGYGAGGINGGSGTQGMILIEWLQ